MNWIVDTPIRIGDTIIAAIVEFKVSVNALGSGLCGYADKKPILFIKLSGGRISGLDINGHAYEADEIELLYPTAIEQVRAQDPDRR